jgi:chemotaxis protein methyltransferase CheR
MNEVVLKQAKTGIFSLKKMQEYTQLYHQAGGKKAFSEYYTAAYDNALFRSSIKDNIVFAHHNLATDNSFNEFNVILCRNVMIYFNSYLQERVHKLFHESLGMFGVLGLGHQESLHFTPYEKHYEAIESSDKLYRRVK